MLLTPGCILRQAVKEPARLAALLPSCPPWFACRASRNSGFLVPFLVYSASNLLVLLNDWILRKELQQSLPMVRLECVGGGYGICACFLAEAFGECL